MRWLALALFLPATAAASTALPLSVAELTAYADVVVLAQVGTPQAVWQGRRIVTVTPVTVEEVWVGSTREHVIEVSTLGGVVGGVGQRVDGEARLVPGEQVVLFLAGQGARFRVLSLAQGAFRVLPDAGAAPRVMRALDGLTLHGSLPALPPTLPELKAAVLDVAHPR
ncbi:MAG: hypothetical protein HYZ27_00955 [Deltaproteobacteria bacterium]|nr:hypothetical protein [Deltaproteobacteria bacterium]